MLPSQQVLVETGDYVAFHATAGQIPHLLQEIGRQREVAFRQVGEGTGRAVDLNQFDQYYAHLCLWNIRKGELVGAYRLGRTDEILRQQGMAGLYTRTLFDYDSQLLAHVGPALELGPFFCEGRVSAQPHGALFIVEEHRPLRRALPSLPHAVWAGKHQQCIPSGFAIDDGRILGAAGLHARICQMGKSKNAFCQPLG